MSLNWNKNSVSARHAPVQPSRNHAHISPLLKPFNTPLQNSDASPTLLLIRHQIIDTVTVDSSNYRASEQWSRLPRNREGVLHHSGESASLRNDVSAHELTSSNRESVTESMILVVGTGITWALL